jgi:hypothetical protein
LDRTHPYTTREYFRAVGEALMPVAQEEGILTAAARHGVPVYSPALGDSVHGLAIAFGRARTHDAGPRKPPVFFDIIGDVLETAHIAATAPATGVIYVGGGTPKNFIQQAEVGGYIFQRELAGHKYAVQITMDQPQWGGLSGCTFEEAQSWRKIAQDATMATVNVEATVALPLIVSALAEGSAEPIKNRRRPVISFDGMPGAWPRGEGAMGEVFIHPPTFSRPPNARTSRAWSCCRFLTIRRRAPALFATAPPRSSLLPGPETYDLELATTCRCTASTHCRMARMAVRRRWSTGLRARPDLSDGKFVLTLGGEHGHR